MTKRACRVSTFSFLSLAALLLALGAAAQEYRVEVLDAPAPEELAPAVREALSHSAVRVLSPEGPLLDIWLRRRAPLRSVVGGNLLGIAYPQLIEGSLTGAIRFHRQASGYRKQRVQPGVYTLRYALHPVDGNHMGVAPQRDFLLLAPAAEDQTREPISFDELMNLSGKATGTRHPSVWSLAEPEEDLDTLPALIHWEEENLWFLYLKAEVQLEGESPSELLLALVIIGHAPEA